MSTENKGSFKIHVTVRQLSFAKDNTKYMHGNIFLNLMLCGRYTHMMHEACRTGETTYLALV